MPDPTTNDTITSGEIPLTFHYRQLDRDERLACPYFTTLIQFINKITTHIIEFIKKRYRYLLVLPLLNQVSRSGVHTSLCESCPSTTNLWHLVIQLHRH